MLLDSDFIIAKLVKTNYETSIFNSHYTVPIQVSNYPIKSNMNATEHYTIYCRVNCDQLTL